jgi:hypothetical protein
MQPQAEVFEQVQANILLAHFNPMERRLRNPELLRKVPVCPVPSAPSYLPC